MAPARPGFEIGIIEGYYGRPWTWAQRRSNLAYFASCGYRFYLYAPKADAYLRRLWREPYPVDTAEEIATFSAECRRLGVRFGMGLSPTGLHLDFGAESKAALARRIGELAALGVQDLALLFDDMRGDTPDLADRQVAIVHWAAERAGLDHIVMCPSYYSDDPILDRIFGARPQGYLDHLGSHLDAAVDIFWTGEEICSREISIAHIQRLATQLRRKPFLWDNYPVNDGARMSQYLHVRAFTGRPAVLREHLAGHGVNPALQPVLSRIPLLTLLRSYSAPADYAYGSATREAADEVLGPALGRLVWEDVLMLQDVGLDRLGERAAALRERYRDIDHDGAREIIAWLDGEYRITDEMVRAQAGE